MLLQIVKQLSFILLYICSIFYIRHLHILYHISYIFKVVSGVRAEAGSGWIT